MNQMEWDLDVLYTSLDSEKYIKDKEDLKTYVSKMNELTKDISRDSFVELLKYREKVVVLLTNMFNYSSLKTAVNVNDMVSNGEMASIQMIAQELVPVDVSMQIFIKDKNIDELIGNDEFLEKYRYQLVLMQKEASHMLSEKEEILYAKLRMVASDGWSEIQSKLTSNLSITVEGFEKPMPLSAVRGLAYDNDATVRKNAYLAELKSYDGVKDAVAMGLNNIKREANIMSSMRGYKNIQAMTLESSHMKEETLNAMIEAIKDELPVFRKYFKLKAQALGHKNGLPFYDLFAPMGNLTKTYTYDEAKELVLDVYKSFSNRLYEMGKRAFDERWIDVLPHEGKVGGAFCCALQPQKQSRVMTNFTGQLSDISTIAHELGHAYHDEVTCYNAPLNWNYPMELAETASILCETLMAKKLLGDVKTKEEKLTLIENSLQGDTQCVVDILSRYLFETKVCNTPVEKPLSADDMCSFMLESQNESYGDGLDPKYLHPYMWLCKGHYYSAGYSFYNWPYAFGLLYARGLYAKYLENKEEFVKNYDQMLINTCIMDAEEVTKCMGIDITKKEFWISSLKTIEEDIDLFEELLK